MRPKMKMFKFFVSIVFLSIALIAWFSSKPELPKYGALPENLVFVNSDNQSKKLSDFKGSPLLLNFFFTSCPKVCPRFNEQIEKTYLELHRDFPNLKVLSVSIDPKKDTPEVLKEYKQRFSFPHGSWILLTGEREDVKTLAEASQLGLPDDPSIHSTKLLLVDKDLEVRGFFPGLTLSEYTEEIRKTLKLL